MTSDQLTNRSFAAAVAAGGLVLLMIQDKPNWSAILVALGCILAFTALWFLPARRPSPWTVPRRIRIEILSPVTPAPRPPILLEGHPHALPPLVLGKPVSRWRLRRWQAAYGRNARPARSV